MPPRTKDASLYLQVAEDRLPTISTGHPSTNPGVPPELHADLCTQPAEPPAQIDTVTALTVLECGGSEGNAQGYSCADGRNGASASGQKQNEHAGAGATRLAGVDVTSVAKAHLARALFDFEGIQPGDLKFSKGDRLLLFSPFAFFSFISILLALLQCVSLLVRSISLFS